MADQRRIWFPLLKWGVLLTTVMAAFVLSGAGCTNRPCLIIPSESGAEDSTGRMSTQSVRELRQRLRLEAKGYLLGPGLLITADLETPPGSDRFVIDHSNVQYITHRGERLCSSGSHDLPDTATGELAAYSLFVSPRSSWCPPPGYDHGDFVIDSSPPADLLRVPLMGIDTSNKVMFDYYIAGKDIDRASLVYSGRTGEWPPGGHWYNRWPADVPQYGDCVSIRFTLTPAIQAPDSVTGTGQVPYLLSARAESKCPDSLHVEVDRAVIRWNEAEETNVNLALSGDNQISTSSGEFAVPSDVFDIHIRFHVVVTYPDGGRPLDGEFFLDQSLLVLTGSALRQIRQGSGS